MKFSDFERDLKIYGDPGRREQPTVSVILPTFSRGDGLLQASVESVLSQSFGDFELIVVDDGSRDETADVLMNYVEMDNRVVVHRYHFNSGLPALRVNQAALRSAGRFIAYQFDDDIWTDGSLEVRVHRIKDASQPSVVYGNCRVLENFGTPDEKVAWLGGEFNFGRLMGGNYIANNTILHHRELFDVAGMYDPHIAYRRYSDYDLWLRFARCAPFHWVDQVVSEVRVNLANSLAKEVPSYFTRYRKSVSIKARDGLLPNAIHEYDLIDPAQFYPVFTPEDVRSYYRSEAVPFLARWGDYCSTEEMSVVASGGMSPVNILAIKPDYSTSIDVTIGNFVDTPHQRSARSTFVREADSRAVEPGSFDLTIMYRTVLETTARFAEQPAGQRGAAAYLMDDNMLHMHELEGDGSQLSPETTAYKSIERQIISADAAIGYSQPIVEDMRALNPHTIRLETNIPARFVGRSSSKQSGKVQIALLSGPVRAGIVRELWPAVERIAEQYRDQVEFHFWGLDPAQFGELPVPVKYAPFTHAYDRYRDALAAACFDVVLIPLEGSFRAHTSKSPIKLLQALSAGAMCVFSDVPPYSELPDSVCVKAGNDIEQWYAAIDRAISLGPAGRNAMVDAARALVLSKYTTERQFFDFFGAMSSVRLHARIGHGAIALAFHETALGGATLHVLRHAELLRSLGFKLVGLAPEDPDHQEEFSRRWATASGGGKLFIRRWTSGYDGPRHRPLSPDDRADATVLAEVLRPEDVRLLHFATWSPAMIQLAKLLGVASVASVHQYYHGADVHRIADSVHCSSLAHGEKWRSASKAPTRRVVCPVGDEYFSLFPANRERASRQPATLRVLLSGTLQPRKGQLVALAAMEMLADKGVDITVDVIGYTNFAPEYVAECIELANAASLRGRVTFHGFLHDPERLYASADVLVTAATDESMPQTILQAMAAGVAVVSTGVGGVTEVIRHRYSGHIAGDLSAEAMRHAVEQYLSLSITDRLELLDRAQRTINLLGRPSYVRAELVDIYLEALGQVDRRPNYVAASSPPLTPSPVSPMGPGSMSTRQEQPTASFASIQRYSDKLHRVHPGDRLQLTEDLRTAAYREYTMRRPVRRALRGVAIGVLPHIGAARGELGLELVSSQGEIMLHQLQSLAGISSSAPATFLFDRPVPPLDAGWLLRVFVKGADVPVTIYEISRRPMFRRQRLERLPFVELLF